MTDDNKGSAQATRRKHNSLSFSQRIEIFNTLKQVVQVVADEPKMCTYIDGYNDAKVAASMPFHCTESNVKGMRVELFGQLASGRPYNSADMQLVIERINQLELAVKALEKRLDEIGA